MRKTMTGTSASGVSRVLRNAPFIGFAVGSTITVQESGLQVRVISKAPDLAEQARRLLAEKGYAVSPNVAKMYTTFEFSVSGGPGGGRVATRSAKESPAGPRVILQFGVDGAPYQVMHLQSQGRVQLWCQPGGKWEIGHAKDIPSGRDAAWVARQMRDLMQKKISLETYNKRVP